MSQKQKIDFSLNLHNDKAKTEYQDMKATHAQHRAKIMQILNRYGPQTTQQIIQKEFQLFGYSFLTDNRLRELRVMGWIESDDEHPKHWRMIRVDSRET